MKLTGRNSWYKFSGVLLTLIAIVFLLGLLGMASAKFQSYSIGRNSNLKLLIAELPSL